MPLIETIPASSSDTKSSCSLASFAQAFRAEARPGIVGHRNSLFRIERKASCSLGV